jgi:hypothetical protein
VTNCGSTGWSLGGGSVVAGNESWSINGTGQSTSLTIDSGGTAVSPIFCNQKSEPSIRFFYKGSSRPRVHLHIDVTDTTTHQVSPLDWEMTVPGNGSRASANGIMTPYLYTQSTENGQLRFTASSGSVQIDDIEIDPWRAL